MAIFQECPNCKRLCGIQTSVKFCPKCKAKLPRDRSYVVEWRTPDEDGHLTQKKKKKLGKCSLDQARAYEAEQRKARNEPVADEEAHGQTWEDVVERFMKRLEVEEAGSTYVKDTRLYLNRMSEFWGRRTLIKDIRPHMIQDFRLSLREKEGKKGLSLATCDRHLAAGKAAWNYSVENLRNPFSRVTFYNPDNEVTRYLSDDERERLLNAAKKVSRHLYEIIVLALATGLRKSNILNLRRDQINFETGTIHVRQKGDRAHMVYLPEEVRDLLRNIPDNGTNFLWISRRTGKPYAKDWETPWIESKKRAGIDPAFRFHDLRHDAGTSIYLASGRDLQTAQKFLGHSQLKTTLRYAHLPADDMVDSINAINPLRRKK